MELTRKQIIDNLSYIADSMPDDACAEWRDSLAYAISSLKTDEAYQVMYEGGEIFIKVDLVAMLEELKEQLREMHEDFFETEHFDEAYGVSNSMDIIQEKIEQLKE